QVTFSKLIGLVDLCAQPSASVSLRLDLCVRGLSFVRVMCPFSFICSVLCSVQGYVVLTQGLICCVHGLSFIRTLSCRFSSRFFICCAHTFMHILVFCM